MVQGDPHVAEPQLPEVRLGAAVGGEGDRLAVGRPGGLEIGVLVPREAAQVAAVRADDEEVREAAVVAREHELLAVGRPGGRREPVERHLDAPHLVAPLGVEDDEVVLILVLRRDGEVATVGGEGARRVDEAQALVVVVERRLHEAAQHSPRLRVGEVEIDEEGIPLPEKGDLASVRRERGREMQRPIGALLREHRLRHAAGAVVLAQLGEVGRLHGVPPLVREVLEREPEGALERPRHAARRRALEDLADHLVAPLLADVRPQGVAEAVGEDPRIVGELLDRGEVPLERRVPQPHGRVGVDGADRQVLRHPLHEPQRRVDADDRPDAGAGVAMTEHVVLELVHHLVLQHVLELAVGPRERQHHAVLEELRDAARGFADLAPDDVRLLEVGAGGVQDDGLAALELVVQHARQPGVGPLRHARGVERGGVLLLVEIHLEVLGLDDLEVEGPVLDLVLPEVLRRERRRAAQRERRQRGHQRPSHEGHPSRRGSPGATTGASPQRRSSW